MNDARAVGDVLRKLGFDVIRGENLGRQLTQRLTAGDTAFFYFSDHGVSRACAERLHGFVETVRDLVAGAPVKHMDETGFRIDGEGSTGAPAKLAGALKAAGGPALGSGIFAADAGAAGH